MLDHIVGSNFDLQRFSKNTRVLLGDLQDAHPSWCESSMVRICWFFRWMEIAGRIFIIISSNSSRGGGFKYFFWLSVPQEMIQFDEYVSIHWNHQLVITRGFVWREPGEGKIKPGNFFEAFGIPWSPRSFWKKKQLVVYVGACLYRVTMGK